MTNITLKQLRYFDALARQSHFGRAAELCSVSQPALSVQIKELENTLGVTLIERAPKEARLTEIGQRIAERITGILRDVDELTDIARASGERLSGRLRLGIIPTIAPYVLPRLIGRLGGLYPALDLHIRETVTPRLLQELTEGQLDAAIMALPVSEPGFAETTLFSEDFVLVRPKSEADLPVPDADALREMKLLLLEEGHCFRDQALSFCHMTAGPPREVLDASSLSTLVQMVGAGAGVTLIPEMAVPVETRSADVAIAHFPPPRPNRQIGMIWRKTSPLSEFLLQISAEVKKLGDRESN